MAYNLRGFIGEPPAMRVLQQNLSSSVLVKLTQGFEMLPLTGKVYQALYDGRYRPSEKELISGFYGLSRNLEKLALEASNVAPLAYIEVELWAGVGLKAAIIWENGAILFGPESLDTEREDIELRKQPVNRALQKLGVERGNHLDEFDALGLERCRNTDEWATQT